jgi:signal transduction histidine kinase
MTAVSAEGRYCGADRRRQERPVDAERRRSAAPPAPADGGRLLRRLAILLLAAVIAPHLALAFTSDATLVSFRSGVVSLGTALYVSAGLSALLRWRLTGDARVALAGTGLLVYGTVNGFFLPLASVIAGDTMSELGAGGVVRALNAVVVICLLVRSLSTPTVNARLRPVQVFVLASGTLTLVFFVLAMFTARSEAPPLGPGTVTGLYTALTVGWAAAAALFVRRAAVRLQADVLWLGLALGCLSLANLIRALPSGQDDAGLLAAAVVSSLAAAVALFGSSFHLAALLGSLGSERLRLRGALVAQEVEQAHREERLHDVRSTLAAIRCAAGTLHRYDEKLAHAQRASLQSAVTAELVRLERLIDPGEQQGSQAFSLSEALTGVVETERALGSQIHVSLGALSATGRSEDTAAIVQNLLVNARRYACGTPITVTATEAEGHVEVAVMDRGPGLTPEERDAVFDRGQRGAAAHQAHGSGLGLFVSRRLATEQGGRLLVTDRPGGGACFLLRLPSAQQSVDELDEVLDRGDARPSRTAVGELDDRRRELPLGKDHHVVRGHVLA